MKLRFLGGADEIGASSTLLEIGGARILVDCGMRHHDRAGERLPALAGIEGKLDAIVLTHAHIDHSGGLPVAAQSYPNIPIYLTSPTLAIVSILLYDSLKIMEMGLAADGEVPIYGLAQIDNALAACRPVNFDAPIKIANDVMLTFCPAGHILGAATAVFESSEGSIVLSGDIHASDQITVPGLVMPFHKPDIFMIESTYGNRQHASRAMEEERLIKRIREIVENKGTVLIPAFAVGRAQELILLVSRAIEKEALPKIPIFVDGMVKQVCGVYTSFPHLVSPWLKRRMEQKGNPFFYEKGAAKPIYDPKTRKEVAQIRPAVIISSSGMVTVGSPSSFYASELAKDPRCLIAISGYQDEESPGRRMLDLAQKGGGELPTANGSVELSCAIESFSFSAHSDGYQVMTQLQSAQPRQIVLVHGTGGAREALAEKLIAMGLKNVHLPDLSGEVEIAAKHERRAQSVFTDRSRGRNKPTKPEVAAANLVQAEDLVKLAETLIERDSTSRTYTIAELLASAGYQPEQLTPAEICRVEALLNHKDSSFVQTNKGRSYNLRVLPGKRIWTPKGDITQADIDTIVKKAFADDLPYKIGVKLANRTVILKFYFPKIILAKYADRLTELAEATKWQFQVSPDPHQEELAKAALVGIPAEWQPGTPSIHMFKEMVIVPVSTIAAELAATLKANFQAQTGFELEFKTATTVTNTPVIINQAASQGAMEINATYATIKQAFADKPHQPLKMGLKGASIELRFITGEVGSLYQSTLAELSAKTGYGMIVRETPDQILLQKVAQEVVPSEWQVTGVVPSIKAQERELIVKVKTIPIDIARVEEISQKFHAMTGWKLGLQKK